MLIKLKKERTHQEDRRLALWLATSAGLLNAIALGAFGFFPSHMTGNTSQLSSEVSSTDLSDILFFGAIILSFVSGAIAARIIVIWGIIHNVRLVFSRVLFVEGLLLAGVSLYEMYFHSFATNQEIIIFLCGLMGIHNSTSTQLSGGRVRSTHITGTLTDAGISLASVMVAMLRRDYSKIRPHKESAQNPFNYPFLLYQRRDRGADPVQRVWIPRDAGAGPVAGNRRRLLYRPHLVARTQGARRAQSTGIISTSYVTLSRKACFFKTILPAH